MTDYDFIEIGCSDFGTLIQNNEFSDAVGMSIEPVKEHLDRLPTTPFVKKICGAISNVSGSIKIFYIPDSVCREYNLPKWIKETNRVNEFHPTVVRYLTKHDLPLSLIACDIAPVYTIAELFEMNSVNSIGYLKIDTEGHDVIIMNSYLDYCSDKPHLLAKSIKFESNSLSNKEDVEKIKRRLQDLGYEVRSTYTDTYAKKL